MDLLNEYVNIRVYSILHNSTGSNASVVMFGLNSHPARNKHQAII